MKSMIMHILPFVLGALSLGQFHLMCFFKPSSMLLSYF